MTDSQRADDLLRRYRASLDPSPSKLDVVWRDVADPDATFRLSHEPAQGLRRTRRLGVMGGGITAAAAMLALGWWLGSRGSVGIEASRLDLHEAAYSRSGPAGPGDSLRRDWTRDVDTALNEGTSPTIAVERPAPSDPRASNDPVVPKRPRDRDRRSTAPPLVTHDDLEPAPRSANVAAADPLTQEMALIHRAEGLLRAGAPDQALVVLETHAREYGHGSFVIERRALRVVALCLDGQKDQGLEEARELLGQAASHPYAKRIRRSCEREPSYFIDRAGNDSK